MIDPAQDSCQLWKRKQEHDGIYWWNSKWEILKPSFLISPPKSWRLNPVVCVIFTAANEKRRLTQDMRAAADKDSWNPDFSELFPVLQIFTTIPASKIHLLWVAWKKFLFVFFLSAKLYAGKICLWSFNPNVPLEQSCNWNAPVDKVSSGTFQTKF